MDGDPPLDGYLPGFAAANLALELAARRLLADDRRPALPVSHYPYPPSRSLAWVLD